MSILRLVTIAGSLLIVALLGVVGIYQLAMRQTKVNGPVYNELVQYKNLVSDIAQPTKSIAAPYLEATLALQEPATAAARIKRLNAMQAAYDERQDFWQKQALDGNLKGLLTEASHKTAAAFWSTLHGRFVPALERGDMAAAQTAYKQLGAVYDSHRAQTEELIGITKAGVASIEAKAADQNRTAMLFVWLASFLMFGLLLAAIAVLIVRVVVPIEELTTTMRDLSRGDLKIDVPFTARQDEIGGMAKALLMFKEAMFAKIMGEEEVAGSTAGEAYKEFRALEQWIRRENPPFQEVQARVAKLRHRFQMSGEVAI